MRAALVSDPVWRDGVARASERGAELVCLPHLSFAPYVAAERDRAGLEHAERTPSRSLREALDLAGGAWLAASAYESEGEGVFYVTSYLSAPNGERTRYRQLLVEAEYGRYEQMFWAPGHDLPEAAELPCGLATTLVAGDLLDPGAWACAAALNVDIVIGGASDPPDRWLRTQRVAAGMAAAYELTVLLVNRADAPFAGGAAAFGPDGEALTVDDGLVELAA